MMSELVTQPSGSNDLNDSGYSSQSMTAENATIMTPKLKQASSETGSSRGVSNSFTLPLIGSKKKKSVINVGISESVRQRFRAIQPHFEKLLLEYIRSNQRPGSSYKPMSTRLMMLGTSDNDASPHIIVFCQPGQKSCVRSFSKQEMIKSLCEEEEGGLRLFQVTVMDSAPRLRLSSALIEALADANTTTSPNTFCGLPIVLQHASSRSQNATLGGIIKVTSQSGDIELYGITAGHPIENFQEDVFNQSQDDVSTIEQKKNSRSAVEVGDEGSSDNDSEIDFFGNNQRRNSEIECDQSSWSFSNPNVIGVLAYSPKVSTQNPNRLTKFYDWALFKMNKFAPNSLQIDRKRRIVLSKQLPGSAGIQPICMISGSGDSKLGSLLLDAGSIIIGPGEEFVQTYMIKLDDDLDICDGDSGSWVVDTSTGELYGYLIASDIFKSGYVVPMKDVFEDIKCQLDALAVDLPEVPDFLLATKTLSETQEDTKPSSKNHNDDSNVDINSNLIPIESDWGEWTLGDGHNYYYRGRYVSPETSQTILEDTRNRLVQSPNGSYIHYQFMSLQEATATGNSLHESKAQPPVLPISSAQNLFRFLKADNKTSSTSPETDSQGSSGSITYAYSMTSEETVSVKNHSDSANIQLAGTKKGKNIQQVPQMDKKGRQN